MEEVDFGRTITELLPLLESYLLIHISGTTYIHTNVHIHASEESPEKLMRGWFGTMP